MGLLFTIHQLTSRSLRGNFSVQHALWWNVGYEWIMKKTCYTVKAIGKESVANELASFKNNALEL